MKFPKKINPQLAVIIILVMVIGWFAYNKWGGGFLLDIKYKFLSGATKAEITIGSGDAKIKIIEYYSYLCEYCKAFENEVKPQIVKNYVSTGKAQLVLRPFPPYELGEAVSCANEQGKFLEFHDYLFKNAETLKEEEDLKVFAKTAGMNSEQFWQCYSSGKYESRAELWYKQGMADFDKFEIPESQRGTPSFVINGEMINGAQAFEVFEEVIERKLAE